MGQSHTLTARSNRTAKGLQAFVASIVLGASAAIITAVAATNQSTGGKLLMLDELRPQYAMVNVIVFICAVAGAAIAVLITLLGRTSAGTITMAFVLIGYPSGPRLVPRAKRQRACYMSA